MKKSAHLVDVPGNSGDAEPLYYDEPGEPVYAQTCSTGQWQNKNKHLIQTSCKCHLEKVRGSSKRPCPTILLKVDTGADVNLLNSTTFDWIIAIDRFYNHQHLKWRCMAVPELKYLESSTLS